MLLWASKYAYFGYDWKSRSLMGRVGIDLFEIRNQFCMLACSKNVHLITGTQWKVLKRFKISSEKKLYGLFSK